MFIIDAVREKNSNYHKWSTGRVIDNKDPIWLDQNPSYDGEVRGIGRGGGNGNTL